MRNTYVIPNCRWQCVDSDTEEVNMCIYIYIYVESSTVNVSVAMGICETHIYSNFQLSVAVHQQNDIGCIYLDIHVEFNCQCRNKDL